ncbi:hypothetical protein KY326_01540 [Candidatus Woesearchaeota archaeon]|nr:hypothetical protein [Candidatus Woesearchaeota archaeon]
MADAVAEEKKTMFTEDERRSVIEDLALETKLRGRPAKTGYQGEAYKIFLNYCSVLVVTFDDHPPCVILNESFGARDFRDGTFSDGPYGVRKEYIGGPEGLKHIKTRGADLPFLDGREGLGSIGELRTSDEETQEAFDWVKPLTDQDREIFDRFLAYARRELRNIIKLQIDYRHDSYPGEKSYFEIKQEGPGIFKTDEIGHAGAILERVQELCIFDPESGIDLIRQKPVYELEITEHARRKISIISFPGELGHIEKTVKVYNERLAAAKRKIVGGD